jgi:uncharacterized SAM-binding protein YcdF (DUF218 family)
MMTRSLVVFGFLALVYIWPALIFYPLGSFLERDDQPEKKADFVLVLMGQPEIRPEAAAKAVMAGYSDRLLFVTSEINPLEEAGIMPSEEVLAKAAISRAGLSSDHINVVTGFGRATSTMDEAIAVRRYFRAVKSPPKRLIIVTSWPHSARAHWTFEKALQDTGIKIEMLPIEAIPYDKSNWWQSERGLLFVFEEYIKWTRYLVKYLGRDIN